MLPFYFTLIKLLTPKKNNWNLVRRVVPDSRIHWSRPSNLLTEKSDTRSAGDKYCKPPANQNLEVILKSNVVCIMHAQGTINTNLLFVVVVFICE
jgi:hypothetical protein